MDGKTISIDNDTHEALRRFCSDRMLKLGAVAGFAIRLYLDREHPAVGEVAVRPDQVPATNQEA